MFDEGGKIVISVRGTWSAGRAGSITKHEISARCQVKSNAHEYDRSKTQETCLLNPESTIARVRTLLCCDYSCFNHKT
jgi:hypothetical protein